MKIIDLSHVFEECMTVFPGMNPPVVEEIANVKEHGYQVTKLDIFTHMGTHLDCKSHVYENGATTSDKDISNFYGKGHVIDCSHLKEGQLIELDEIKKYDIKDIDYLLFYTGWDKYWKEEKYLGDFPVISKDLADFLTNSSIKGIGLDVISIDKIDDPILSTHQVFLKNDKVIVENLTGLEKLINKDFDFCCFPIKIKNGDGSPVRAVALVE